MLYFKNQPLLDHQSKQLTENSIEDGTPVNVQVTLGYALERVLINGGQTSDDGNTKFKQFLLAKKIHDANELLDLSVEEVANLKVLAAPLFSPVGLGSIFTALENPTTAEQQLAAPPAPVSTVIPIEQPVAATPIVEGAKVPVGVGIIPAVPEDIQ